MTIIDKILLVIFSLCIAILSLALVLFPFQPFDLLSIDNIQMLIDNIVGDYRYALVGLIFFLISIIYWIIGDFSDKYLTLLVIGSSLPILKGDLKGQYMLGDVGANILGYTLAFTGMISLNFYYKMISIVLLIVLHIIAETKSISSIINKVPLLRYLDYLGREK